MKKKLLVLLSAVMAAAVLGACGEEEVPVVGLEPIPIESVTASSTPAEESRTPASSEEAAESSAEVAESSEENKEDEKPQNTSHEGMYRSELTGEWIDGELQNQRPIAAMVDNESIAYDHYGVNSADIVYELMNSTANGRITRLMCIVKDWKKIEQFGSIRSVRPTNFMLAAEYNAVLIHDGGPYYIDQYCARDYTAHLSGGFARFTNGKKSEYTEYITYEKYTNPNTGKSYDGLGQRMKSAKISEEYNKYYPGEHFQFASENKPVDLSGSEYSKTAKTIELPYPHNKSALYYDESKKVYEYWNYGSAHIDPMDNNNVTTFKNLIIQNCSFAQLDEHGYMIYNCIGSGDGWYITNGTAFPILWSKTSESGITRFINGVTGEDITLNVGKTYVTLVPSDKWSDLVIK